MEDQRAESEGAEPVWNADGELNGRACLRDLTVQDFDRILEKAKESLLQSSSREQQLLQAIDSALGRIRDGTYGKCLSCGKEIDGRRLAAVPWTPFCIPCEEEFER